MMHSVDETMLEPTGQLEGTKPRRTEVRPHRSRVFDRFVRLDDAWVNVDDGSGGLGLAIVAEVVAAHGGEVQIGDAPSGGARVTVRIPLLTS